MLLLISVISLIGTIQIRESFRGRNRDDYRNWIKQRHENKPPPKDFTKDIKNLSDKVDNFTNEFKMYKDIIERYILRGYVISDMKPSINERMERIEKELNI